MKLQSQINHTKKETVCARLKLQHQFTLIKCLQIKNSFSLNAFFNNVSFHWCYTVHYNVSNTCLRKDTFLMFLTGE